MFKKAICLLVSAASLFALCSCDTGSNNNEDETATKQADEFKSFVISKDNTNLIERGEDIPVGGSETYCMLKYDGKHYIVQQLESGNFDALYELGENDTVLNDATARAGGRYIYFTADNALKAYFIATKSVLDIVNAPCSNFITLDIPESFELYPYGFIATATEICVVDLGSASLSSYTKSLNDMKAYIDAPEKLIGTDIRTTLSAHSKTSVRLTVETLKSNGEVKQAEEILFTPLLGVFKKAN